MDRYDFQIMFAQRHWLQRGRAARFFVEICKDLVTDPDLDPLVKLIAHLREIERGALHQAAWSGPQWWSHKAINPAADFALEYYSRVHEREYRAYGSIEEWIKAVGYLAPGVAFAQLQRAVVESITFDLMDGNDQPDTEAAIRALLMIGQHDKAVDLADRRLPKPKPTYTNWPSDHDTKRLLMHTPLAKRRR